MEPNVQQNLDMVKQMMAQAEAEKKAALIQQGNKAHIPVDIDYTADSGAEYKGAIIFRRPSSMDYIRMGAAKADMIRLSGIRPLLDPATGRESMAHVDAGIMLLITAMSTIKVVMVDCPDWFKDYENMFDTDLVIHVYSRFDQELLSFRRPTANQPTGSSQAQGNQDTMDREETLRG